MAQAVSRWLVTAESRFLTGPVHVGFVVDEVVLGRVSLRAPRLYPVCIIPPWLSILTYHRGMNKRPVDGLSAET
jgi:hypothetical protein